MKKVNITIVCEEEKLLALEFALKKAGACVQGSMEKALDELYESAVPEAVREYVEAKLGPAALAKDKPKRPARPTQPKAKAGEPEAKPLPPAPPVKKEDE